MGGLAGLENLRIGVRIVGRWLAVRKKRKRGKKKGRGYVCICMLLLADGILGVIASSHYGEGVWRCV